MQNCRVPDEARGSALETAKTCSQFAWRRFGNGRGRFGELDGEQATGSLGPQPNLYRRDGLVHPRGGLIHRRGETDADRDSFRATVIRLLCLRDFPIVRSGERRPGYIVKFDKWIAEPSLSRTSDGY